MSYFRGRALKILVIFLFVILIMGNNISYASTVFTDVPSTHWAKEFIDKMNTLGIITGTSNNTFQPNLNVPVSQAVVMMARLLKPTRAEINTAMNIYGSLINEVGVETWAREQMAYALHKGIITEAELKASYIDGKAKTAQKLEICRYLTKALGLEERARSKEIIVFEFNDTATIPEPDRPYVGMMIEIGIINPYGDVLGNFNPRDPMNRAMMAKALSIAYDYNEAKKLEDHNQKNKNITGLIEEINYGSKISLKIKDNNNNMHVHTISDNPIITKGTNNLSLLDIKVGDPVDIRIVNDLIASINIKTSTSNGIDEEVEGTITSITISSSIQINIKDKSGNDKTYKVAEHGITILDGRTKTLLDLRSGYTAKLKIQNGEVIVVFAEAKNVVVSDRFTGVVEFIDAKQKAFILRPEGKDPQRIDIATNTTYVNTVSSLSTFEAIKVKGKVTVIGKLTNGRFIAETIVIMD